MEWYYADTAQQQIGPVSDSEIQNLISNGTVKKTTMVWNESMSGWLPLEQTQLNVFSPRVAPPPMSPISPMTTPPSGIKKNEPLTTWALVLGIISIVGCGILAGIPAVICGHVGLSRIKKNPSLSGRGKAVAGLITGYLSILIMGIVAVLTPLALPGIKMGIERSKAQEMLDNMKQIHLVLQQVASDATTTGDKTIGWPADAQLKSKAELKKMLVPAYISAGDYDRMQFDRISIGNVSEGDPADTILLESKPANGGSTVILLKSGQFGVLPSPTIVHAQINHWRKNESRCQILEAGQPFGNLPPRTPAFLE